VDFDKEVFMGWGYGYGYGGFAPYVSVAQRRANAARQMDKLTKKGQVVSPVKIAGRTIAASFWGEGWCDHMESYSDFANRLPRGRTYVRNGSVLDLQIQPGKISALVMGSELYHIKIAIEPLKKVRWEALKRQCAGQIKSVLELLKGGVSAGVMEVMSHRENGMFPAPKEINMECSCPDSACLCKHLAAVLYGIGSRLDTMPELLFTLRQVDPAELIAQAAATLGQGPVERPKDLRGDELSEVFGIDLVDEAQPDARSAKVAPAQSPPVKVVRQVVRKAAALRAQAKIKAQAKSKIKIKAKAGTRRARSAIPF
jgi:uncharacterized Zn finger protein